VCHQKTGHRYEAICINCGKKIPATLEQIKKGKMVFCSHRCRTKEFIAKESLNKMALTQFKEGERRSPKTEFQKGFQGGQHFPKGHIAWNDTNTIIQCDHCGKEVKRGPKRARGSTHNYCSKSCSNRSKYNGGEEEQQRRMREASVSLSDKYIRTILGNAGMKAAEQKPAIIELKRQQLALYRELKQIKKEVSYGAT
jgi:endogenous inhibitor of DNA gyrase (YacG/DUF329 family)